ncbi:hypothetical protein PTSG_08596 [Salpingoeca rosetta]|uniref:Uncharacterized protein n=1 Tax=Salpingoeca rosetta (strain ATCC 50818 / BSB-021) TaxID=946362 RepID=F2UK50_SALR5|nr:uncharacterized protein PTSG_08596 [Salpingoeca rosetta]EGD77499.1 hypothetical protein PTSG_08596 [Salpingoeca rosetta]|eukprot:XP_004990387.1 hypothetical protein PTSG_08596 [Salpingoeca rosetta]
MADTFDTVSTANTSTQVVDKATMMRAMTHDSGVDVVAGVISDKATPTSSRVPSRVPSLATIKEDTVSTQDETLSFKSTSSVTSTSTRVENSKPATDTNAVYDEHENTYAHKQEMLRRRYKHIKEPATAGLVKLSTKKSTFDINREWPSMPEVANYGIGERPVPTACDHLRMPEHIKRQWAMEMYTMYDTTKQREEREAMMERRYRWIEETSREEDGLPPLPKHRKKPASRDLM